MTPTDSQKDGILAGELGVPRFARGGSSAQPSAALRRIDRVALRHPNGRLWTCPAPMRHLHIIGEATRYGWTVGEIAASEQGFTDSDGNFLNRRAAMRVADESGQLNRKPGGYQGPDLYSEDLW